MARGIGSRDPVDGELSGAIKPENSEPPKPHKHLQLELIWC